MQDSQDRYGFRNRMTGQMVRAETRYDQHEDTNYEHLTLDVRFPVYLCHYLGMAFTLRYNDEVSGERLYDIRLPGRACDYDIIQFEIGTREDVGREVEPVMRQRLVSFDVRPEIRWSLTGRQSRTASAIRQLFGEDVLAQYRGFAGELVVAMLHANEPGVDEATLAGTILAGSWNGAAMPPLGILKTTSRDGHWYALLTADVANTGFATFLPTVKPEPWKAARVVTTEVVFATEAETLQEAGLIEGLPLGWAFAGLSGGEARFTVAGVPSEDDGRAVLAALRLATTR